MIARTDAEIEALHLRVADAIRMVPPGWSPLDVEDDDDGTVTVVLSYVGAIRARVTVPPEPPDRPHRWQVRVYWSFDAPGYPWGCAQAIDGEVKDDALALFLALSESVAILLDAHPSQAALALLWPDQSAIDRVAAALNG